MVLIIINQPNFSKLMNLDDVKRTQIDRLTYKVIDNEIENKTNDAC